MGYGMDEEDWGGAMADEHFREDELHKGRVVIRDESIDIRTISLARLQGMRRRFAELALEFGDMTEWYSVYHEMVVDEIDRRRQSKVKADAAYEIAKAKPYGATAHCATCGKQFTKKHKDQAFCSNARTAGKNNCKDRFWNNKRS